MNISKTTFNMALKRGLQLTTVDVSDSLLLCIWETDNDCEWLCSYHINSDSLSYNGNICLPENIKQELPATIFTEKQLREVIKFVSEELARDQ